MENYFEMVQLPSALRRGFKVGLSSPLVRALEVRNLLGATKIEIFNTATLNFSHFLSYLFTSMLII